MSLNRKVLVVGHRWIGLSLAVFLILVGATGSLLVFWQELNERLAPALYPGTRPGPALQAAELALRAEALVPDARATAVYLGYRGTVWVGVEPRPSTPPLPFNYVYLDPVTGDELGRVQWGAWPTSLAAIMPFGYELHETLTLGSWGGRVLGVVALVWFVDCFVAFALTLPRRSATSARSALERWRPAWS